MTTPHSPPHGQAIIDDDEDDVAPAAATAHAGAQPAPTPPPTPVVPGLKRGRVTIILIALGALFLMGVYFALSENPQTPTKKAPDERQENAGFPSELALLADKARKEGFKPAEPEAPIEDVDVPGKAKKAGRVDQQSDAERERQAQLLTKQAEEKLDDESPLVSGGSTNDRRKAQTAAAGNLGLGQAASPANAAIDALEREIKAAGQAQPARPTLPETDSVVLQNRQQQKSGFEAGSTNGRNWNAAGQLQGPEDNILRTGTIVRAALYSAINSDLPGDVLAMVTQDVRDQTTGNVLIPHGTKLYGAYNSELTYGQNRLQVLFYRLIFPNNAAIDIGKISAGEADGRSGLTGDVNNHIWRILGGAVLTSILAIGANVAAPQQTGGFAAQTQTPAQVAASSLAQSASQVGSQITQKNLSIQPTIEINEPIEFDLTLNTDLRLPPYNDQSPSPGRTSN